MVEPIPAASLIMLRDEPLEVLMMQRHENSSFVPSVWVFPGGATEDDDRAVGGSNIIDVMRVAAARETYEETGIWLGDPQRHFESSSLRELMTIAPLDLQSLVWTSRWITPAGLPKRFDTYFFLAGVPGGISPVADKKEAVEVVWIKPSDALARGRQGSFPMVFPTIRNLEAIASFQSSQELMLARRGAEIPTIEPVLGDDGGRRQIVLP